MDMTALRARLDEAHYIYDDEIFCEQPQNLVKQRISPHFLTTETPNYYEFTTKE